MSRSFKAPITSQQIARCAADPMCYPQLDPRKDFEPELTYAQRLRYYIDFVVREDSKLDHEDPTQLIIY